MSGIAPGAVLFDFDFTLADSSAAIVECVSCALAEVGRPPAAERDIRACIGLSLPEVLETLGGPCTATEKSAFYGAFQRRADVVMEPATVVFPEAVELVRELRERRIRTGIVSTKLRTRISSILEARGLAMLFDTVVGIEDVPACKPDPSGLLLALDRLCVERGRAMYVGDHLVDAEAAMRAGVSFIGVLTGMTTRDSFAGRGAACAADLVALGEHLRGMSGR